MKIRVSIILLLLGNLSFAISESRYQAICKSQTLSLQGQMICKKHANNIHPDNSYAVAPKNQQITNPSKSSSQKKNATQKPMVQAPALSSKQRRERLNFKPYVPGGYATKPEENNE